jgi:hypothetical protein
MIKSVRISTDASGNGSGRITGLRGIAPRIAVQYDDDVDAGTDVVIAEGDDYSAVTLMTLTNNKTDIVLRPLYPAHDATGAVITDQYLPLVLGGGVVTVTVSGAGEHTNAVMVSIMTVE